MKKVLFIIVIGLLSVNALSQFKNKVTLYDFNNGIDKDIEQGNVLPSDEYNKSVKFPGESFLTFKRMKNVKELHFQYQFSINTGTLEFRVLIRKSSEKQFTNLKEFSFNNNPVNPQNLYDAIINIPKSDEIDIKIATKYPDGSLGQFYIDNVKFIQSSPEELAFEKRKEEYLKESAKLDSAQSIKVKIDSYNKKLELVKNEYKFNVGQLKTLSYRANVLATLSKLVVFINKRNQVCNPTSYSIFNKKIDIIKENCDSIQINLINKLTEDIKPKEFSEPNIQLPTKQKSGFFKVVQVLGNVGNIITGGQFKSVVNSIQGIVSTVYDPAKIKSKIPEVITKYTKKDTPYFIKNPKYSLEKVDKLIKDGIKVQKFLFDFFEIIEKDREDFNQIVTEFEYHSRNTDLLIASIDQTRVEFFDLINSPMSDEYYLNTFLNVKNENLLDLENKVEIYFNKLILVLPKNNTDNTTSITTKNVSDLEKADVLNKKIITLLRDYKNHSADLRTLFSSVELDLNKPNPFGKYDDDKVISEQKELFGDAYSSYEKLRVDAKTSFTSLKTNLDKVLN